MDEARGCPGRRGKNCRLCGGGGGIHQCQCLLVSPMASQLQAAAAPVAMMLSIMTKSPCKEAPAKKQLQGSHTAASSPLGSSSTSSPTSAPIDTSPVENGTSGGWTESLTRDEVIRHLRVLRQPATLFGEDDAVRLRRLNDVLCRGHRRDSSFLCFRGRWLGQRPAGTQLRFDQHRHARRGPHRCGTSMDGTEDPRHPNGQWQELRTGLPWPAGEARLLGRRGLVCGDVLYEG
jgi:hypothetical protein